MVKVSVVIPVYNCEKYVSRCIESLLKQSLKEIEIILIDDGSTDCSLDICTKFAEKYTNIKVKHIENSGATWARMEGIQMASGEYIGFVDSDDWVAEEMYGTLYKEAQRLDADIIQCGIKIVISEKETVAHNFNPQETRTYSYESALMQLFGAGKENEFNFPLVNKIYKSDVLKNIEMPVHIRSINDVPVIPRAFYGARKVAVTDEQYVYYFMRNDESNKSTMDELRLSKEKFIRTHIEAFNNVSLYFKNLNQEMYLASLKHTIAWSLSALKSKTVSKEGKKEAITVIKESQVIGNKYIPFKKKIVAICFQLIFR